MIGGVGTGWDATCIQTHLKSIQCWPRIQRRWANIETTVNQRLTQIYGVGVYRDGGHLWHPPPLLLDHMVGYQ